MKSLIKSNTFNAPQQQTQEICFPMQSLHTHMDPLQGEREIWNISLLNIFIATAPEKWCLLQEKDRTKILKWQV